MTGPSQSTLPLETLDKERVLHPATSIADHLVTGPRIMAEGTGLTLTDTTGRQYLDAVAGLWCVAIGYGRTEVAEAMAAQSRRLAFYHTFTSMSNEPQIRLADRLLALAPGRMSKVFFGTSGSEANDTQVKLVWYYNNLRGRPRKKKIIARRDGFHGTTVAAASLTGIEAFHRAFDLPLPQILHTSPAYHYRYAAPGQSEEDYASALATELESAHRAGGAGHGGRLHRGARDGRGGRGPPTARLLREGPARAAPPRRADDRRRGHLRLRAPGPPVRVRGLRDRARSGDGGQAAHQRLLPALGLLRLRGDLECPARGLPGARSLRPRLHLQRSSGGGGGGHGQPRHRAG